MLYENVRFCILVFFYLAFVVPGRRLLLFLVYYLFVRIEKLRSFFFGELGIYFLHIQRLDIWHGINVIEVKPLNVVGYKLMEMVHLKLPYLFYLCLDQRAASRLESVPDVRVRVY